MSNVKTLLTASYRTIVSRESRVKLNKCTQNGGVMDFVTGQIYYPDPEDTAVAPPTWTLSSASFKNLKPDVEDWAPLG